MTFDTDTARKALVEALDRVLVALVALQGLEDLEPPADALDTALGLHEPYTRARDRFRDQHRNLHGHVPDEAFYNIESTVYEMVVTAADVAFRVGATTRTRS